MRSQDLAGQVRRSMRIFPGGDGLRGEAGRRGLDALILRRRFIWRGRAEVFGDNRRRRALTILRRFFRRGRMRSQDLAGQVRRSMRIFPGGDGLRGEAGRRGLDASILRRRFIWRGRAEVFGDNRRRRALTILRRFFRRGRMRSQDLAGQVRRSMRIFPWRRRTARGGRATRARRLDSPKALHLARARRSVRR